MEQTTRCTEQTTRCTHLARAWFKMNRLDVSYKEPAADGQVVCSYMEPQDWSQHIQWCSDESWALKVGSGLDLWFGEIEAD